MTGKSGRGIRMDLLERTVKVVFMFRCYASTGGSFFAKRIHNENVSEPYSLESPVLK